MATANGYVRGNIPADQKFRGQAELIMNELVGTDPKTVEAIAKAITASLQTRQDPERVVSYYMSVWKKKGWVKVIATETPEGTDGAGNNTIVPEDAASTGATAEQHAEADVESQVEALSQDMKTSEAVMFALKRGGDDPLKADELVAFLNGHGYTVKESQVTGALQNLVRRGSVTRIEGEGYRVNQ